MKRHSRILVVRTDRIGDVVLSLPVVTALRKHDPDATIDMLVHPDVRDIVENHPDLDHILFDDEKGIAGLCRLVRKIRRYRFDAALCLHPTPRLALVLALAGIPTRIGTGYRFYSFLFSRRIWEHRKPSLRHEAEYNLSLTVPLGMDPGEVEFRLPLSLEALESVEAILRRIHLEDHHPLIILHPGTRGSALDWPLENFAKLADLLVRKAGAGVIITGGRDDASTVETVQNLAEEEHRALVDCLTLKELTALLKKADLVVANSTGPLHIAAALGTRVVGLYPPVIPMSPVRWGPYGQPHAVLIPDEGPCMTCRGDVCEAWNCMESIPVERVLRSVLDNLPSC